MTAVSQSPAVIDLTQDDDVICTSSNDASDARASSQAPSAAASGASTPKSKKRKRRKKGKSLNAIIAEHVKESFSQATSASQSSVPNKSQTSEEEEGVIEETIGEADDEVGIPTLPSSKMSTVPPKHKRKPPLLLFEVDTAKGEVSAANVWDGASLDPKSGTKPEARLGLNQGLLLPSHATVLGEGSAEMEKILAEAEASFADVDPNEESFVDFQDEDKGFRRYWEIEDNDEERKRSIVCAKCGREGHRMKVCTAVICEKCGVRDEHLTRSCPMSKKCFTCGMTGHINKDCPNRYNRQYNTGCDRCGSGKHVSLECPSLWRVYEYLSDHERKEVCETRASKASLPLLEGGAAYIAADEWCYFCGENGHLGDDCPDSKYMPYRPEEPSAFGMYNLQTGPFSDVQYGFGEPQKGEERRLRKTKEFVSAVGLEPGRRGREKRMKSERERTKKWEVEDEGDWFGRRRREGQDESDHRRRDGREHPPEKRTPKSLMVRLEKPGEVKKSGRGEYASLMDRVGMERRETGRNQPRYDGGYGR